MAVTFHRVRGHSHLAYHKVGSYKVLDMCLMDVLLATLGEDKIKEILSMCEKDEDGFVVGELKQ